MQDMSIRMNGNRVDIRRADGVTMSASCSDSTSSFTSSELLATALGSCIAASLSPLFARHGLDETSLHIELQARTGDVTRGFRMQIAVPACDDDVFVRLQRAVERCPVRQALNIPVILDWQVG